MRLYKKEKFELTINRAFPEVIEQCALLRQGDTWISEEIIDVYTEMHKLGLAHSFEVWLDGALVGGLYGVAIGKAFFGESMFQKVTDTSKIALVFLVEFLKEQNFQLLDCQYLNPHLLQFGAYEVTQEEYLLRLQGVIHTIS